MSTTPPAGPSPSTTPSSPPPNSDASTLLFGFLVSALSIFGVFMTSAIIWNRLVARRHAIEAMSAMSPPDSPRVRRPMMWDILIKPDKQPPSWLEIKPVAAQECDFPPSSSRTTRTEQTIPFWRRHLLNPLPPEIVYLFHRPIPPAPPASIDSVTSQVELTHGSDIQVSLLIAMPHASQSTRTGTQENHHTLHEMVFATTNVLYYDPASS
ncbi:hypothetical protein L210DRAFT_2307677 [Boletus edulis BED1]|uniref:Uncharacterized protein n=1 Tax=Boletus edulis BED1 TaxID=1328754 RepID=A0AAD4GDQ7_BOLED|nr:hypothetical protein L210DRAFT_2307677 [Boletus edulis BED1]